MIKIIRGDLFATTPRALAHGVNCVGAMGKGVAKEFRRRYPMMYEWYVRECGQRRILPGGSYAWNDQSGVTIFNLATQYNIGANAREEDLTLALRLMEGQCRVLGITEVHMPMIACGIGGLKEDALMRALDDAFGDSPVTAVVHKL